MGSGVLRGREHAKLGAVATLFEGPCAIALSRGGHRKTYRHRADNEDAAGFVLGPEGALLCVADGHEGWEASELAIERILARGAERWTAPGTIGARWVEDAGAAIADLHAELVAGGAIGGNPDARTTLAFALARPAEDLLGFASVGDSHVFVSDADGILDLALPAADPPAFLGTPSLDASGLARHTAVGARSLAGARALLLATDGLSEHGIGVADPELAVFGALDECERVHPALRALEAARAIVDLALDAHRRQRAGDNVAAAAWCVEG